MGIVKDFYCYSVTFNALTFGTSQPGRIAIEADANFIIDKMTYFATIAGAAQTDSSRVVPLVTFAMNDSGSGRNLQNEAVFLPSIAGSGELPFVLPEPRKFSANSVINLTASNVSAGTDYEFLQVTFIGYKEFMFGR